MGDFAQNATLIGVTSPSELPSPEPDGMPTSGLGAPMCPLWSAIFVRLGLSPVWASIGLAVGLFVAFLALDLLDGNLTTLLAGEVAPWLHVEIRSALAVSILVAGVVAAHRYEELGTARDLARLQPHLRAGVPVERVHAAGALALSPLRLHAVGMVGALLVASIVPTLYLDPSRFLRPETYALPSVWFDLFIGAVLGWTTIKTLVGSFAQDRAFARLANDVAEVDLLDLSNFRPFARRGQRRALRWLVLVSAGYLAFVDATIFAPPALILSAIVAIAMLSFLMPVFGAHRRIQAEKERALGELHTRLAAERARVVRREPGDLDPGGRLADLLSYEARIQAVRPWPIDAAVVTRLAFYLLLPLGSWVAAAMVERMLSVALD